VIDQHTKKKDARMAQGSADWIEALAELVVNDLVD